MGGNVPKFQYVIQSEPAKKGYSAVFRHPKTENVFGGLICSPDEGVNTLQDCVWRCKEKFGGCQCLGSPVTKMVTNERGK